MDRPLGFRDLKDVHPEVHDNLKKLLAYTGNVEEMGLFFQVPLLQSYICSRVQLAGQS